MILYTQKMMSPSPPKKTKVLLTGFMPFGDNVNVSEEVVKGIHLTHPNLEIVSVILPVLYQDAEKIIAEQVAKHHPDLILSLGELNDENAAGMRMEIMAHSKSDHLDVHKKSGKSLTDNLKIFCHHVELNGALAAFWMKNFDSRADAYRLSSDGGNYLCNDVFYQSLKLQEAYGKKGQAVFIHLNDLDMTFSQEQHAAMVQTYTKTLSDFLTYIGDHPNSFVKPQLMSEGKEIPFIRLSQFQQEPVTVPFKPFRPPSLLRSNP